MVMPLTPKLTPNATETATTKSLRRREELAEAVMGRLDAGEALAAILPAARRMARVAGREADEVWLEAEVLGFSDYLQAHPPPADDDKTTLGMRKFLTLRSQPDLRNYTAKQMRQDVESGKGPARTSSVSAPIGQLERMSRPAAIGSMTFTSTAQLDSAVTATTAFAETRRILDRERAAVYELACSIAEEALSARHLVELLGEDAPVVLAAGGEILAELRHAIESLEQPGMAATAASQARTALLTMGRELHPENQVHTSPLTGKAFQTSQEVNKLHAHIDQAWDRADDFGKEALEGQHANVERAYELGSRAKTPNAITHSHAQEAVILTYQIAEALCFAGSFSRPGQHSAKPSTAARIEP